MKIYIDTNVFLDFYQSATDRLAVFDEIEARAQHVLLTQQTIEEFYRNRVSRLLHLADSIDKSANYQIYTTAIVRALPGFKQWEKARDTSRDAAKEIAKELRSWVVEDKDDLVLVAFNKIVAAAETLPTTSGSITKAKERKVLGRPPTSPDKYTIGDELIWETILTGSRDDVIVVSRDHTFINNQAMLKKEFLDATKRELLLVTPSLSEALERLGKASEKVKAAEVSLANLRRDFEFDTYVKCPKCGGELTEVGFEGSDGDSAWWWSCTRCNYEEFPEK